jgi:hypothetical protein
MEEPTMTITPADAGIIAAALEDAARLGLGDDDTVDLVRDALTAAGFTCEDAEAIAYSTVHTRTGS